MAAAEIDDIKLVNGYKFSVLLVDYGTEALRSLLLSYINSIKPPKLANILANNKKLLYGLHKRKFLLHSQWNKLFPSSGSADLQCFDISLIVFLLRNVFKLPAPKTGWDKKPCPTDVSTEAAVLTIKWFRNNTHAHAVTVGLDTTEFETHWRDVASALVRLGTDRTKINQLKASSVRRESWLKKLYKCNFIRDIKFLAGKYHTDTRLWIFELVEEWFVHSEQSVFVLVANAGMGKSVIAAELCTRKKERLAAWHFCHYSNKLRKNPRTIIQSLARMLCEKVPEFEVALLEHASTVDITDLNLVELFTVLLEEPANMIPDPRFTMLILIDALDECDSEELVDIISEHFHRLPRWIKCFVTTRPQSFIERKLSCFKPLVINASSKENLSDIRKLFEEKLQEFQVNQEDKRVISVLTDQSEGLMLYAYFIVESVKQNVLKLDSVCRSFPRGISSVYDTNFKRLEGKLGVDEKIFFKFLEALAAAADDLPVDLATAILEMDSKMSVMDTVSILLPIRKDCFHVFHKSIVDWLSSKEIYGAHTFSISVDNGHQVLADQCEKIFLRIKDSRNLVDKESPEVSYALQFGLRHMCNSVNRSRVYREKLYRFSCDLEIVYAKLCCSSCSVHSLIEEMALIMKCMKSTDSKDEDFPEMEDYMKCFRRHPYILKKNPKLIFQLMANEAESVSLALQANTIGKEVAYCPDVWFGLDNKEQFQSQPIVSKYQCSKNVFCCDVSPDKKLAVFGCEEGVIVLWSLESGQELWLKNDRPVDAWPEDERCNYCVFLPDLSSLSRSHTTHAPRGIIHGRLDQMYAIDGKRLPLFPSNTYTFIDSCFSPNGRFLLTRDSHITSRIILWDLRSGNAKLSFEEKSQSIACCTFSRFGTFVITGSFATGLSIWDTSTRDVDSGKPKRYINSSYKPSSLHCVISATKDSQYLFLSSSDNSKVLCYKLTNCALGSEVQLNMPNQPSTWWLGVSKDGTCVYVRENAKLTNTRLPITLRAVPVSNESLQFLTNIDDSRVIMKSSRALYVYKTFATDEIALVARHQIRNVRFSLEGDIIYASSDEGLLMFQASNGKLIRTDHRQHGIKSFCLTFDGMKLLLRRNQTIKVCDAMTTEVIKTLELPRQTQAQFLCLPEYLLGFSKDGAMQVWNMDSGDLLGENECHSALISCCDVAPTLDRVISCDVRGETILTNLDAKKVVRRIFTDTVLCCKFSPDGRFFAIGDSKGGLSLWDGDSGEPLWGTQAHTDAITGCAFLPRNNRLVLTGSADGTLKAWEEDTRLEVGFMSFEEEIRDIAISSRDSKITVALAHGIAVISAEYFKENYPPDFVIGAKSMYTALK